MSIAVLGIEKYFCFDIFKSDKIKKTINIVIVRHPVSFSVNFNKVDAKVWKMRSKPYAFMWLAYGRICQNRVEFVMILDFKLINVYTSKPWYICQFLWHRK